MTGPGRRRANMSLREAASVVFGLAAVLPTLLFVYLLSSANLLHRPDVQIGLLSALGAVIRARAGLRPASGGGPTARRSLENTRRAAEGGAAVARRVQRFSRLHPLSAPVAVDLGELAADVVELTRRRWDGEAP